MITCYQLKEDIVAVFSIKSFGGIAPIVPAQYLENGQAQTALNCPVFQGSIQTLTDVGAKVADLQKKLELFNLYIVLDKTQYLKTIIGFIGTLTLMYVVAK